MLKKRGTWRLRSCKIQRSWTFGIQNATNIWWNYRYIRPKNNSHKKNRLFPNRGIFEIIDVNETLEYISPDNVKVAITIDDVSRKSKLNINQPSIFTKKSYSYIILGFIQSYSGVLGEIEGFVQLIPGRYKSDNSVNITGID